MLSKKLVLLLVFIVAASMLFFIVSRNKPKQESPTGALYVPLLAIRNEATGRTFSQGDLENKVLFVNFWASWCPPCKEEMPSIESLYRELGGNDKFQMITILYRESYQDGISYVRENRYTLPVYSDGNGSAARAFGVTGVPETYVIDTKGLLKKRVIGPADWNSPEAKAFLQSLLNE